MISHTTERFVVALFFAVLIHVVGISSDFIMPPLPKETASTTMEVIIVQKSTEVVPEKADYLAQVNYKGGGEKEQEHRPATPTIAPFPDQTAEIVFTPPPNQVAAALTEYKTEILAAETDSQHQVEVQPDVIPPEEPAKQGQDLQTENDYVSENEIFVNEFAIKFASMQAEFDRKYREYSKRPRQEFINSSTKVYKYANYMDTWRRKVEDVGTKFYQDNFKEISGSVVLKVALNSDGTVRNIEITTPSNHNRLDEAALQIVHLALPFEPFPEAFRQEVDILHITRTWIFNYDSLISR
ncbi:TonB family protein [Candidatus Halobeggiatoa sp. HSG11]|nr:TonB family protein [Candidatus Halobeggiatoa sp. HSG11]